MPKVINQQEVLTSLQQDLAKIRNSMQKERKLHSAALKIIESPENRQFEIECHKEMEAENLAKESELIRKIGKQEKLMGMKSRY
jgi:hypothetical protein